jgi:hypothetical protein
MRASINIRLWNAPDVTINSPTIYMAKLDCFTRFRRDLVLEQLLISLICPFDHSARDHYKGIVYSLFPL